VTEYLKRSGVWMVAVAKRQRAWVVPVILTLGAAVYWGLLAADRYVSEAHVLVENTQGASASGFDLSSVLGGASSANSRDLLLLRDYLLSADMLRKLDGKFNLRAHYHGSHDVLSRLWSTDVSNEWLLWHYQSRVEVEYDDYAGILLIRAQAYTPAMAHAIANSLVAEGERFINELAHKRAREQVAFAEGEVAAAGVRVADKRQALVAYQNQHGLVSPSTTIGTLSAVVARLEGELSSLHARRRMLAGYLAPQAPELVQVNAQARAIEQQLDFERARLASPTGPTLNVVAERYERMVLEAEFALDLYRTALAALEQLRIEATRTLKKVSVIQQPTMPERSLEPRRLYSVVVFMLAVLLLTGILNLIITIIQEHRD
jgi:capsular polysaccharide transport system permease protein